MTLPFVTDEDVRSAVSIVAEQLADDPALQTDLTRSVSPEGSRVQLGWSSWI